MSGQNTKRLATLDGEIVITFWGCRGTLTVPGEKTVRYGGNTNCVTLNMKGKSTFVFDAGTGIKELSNYIHQENQFPYSAKIFISHPHYDHINGIPYFAPLYKKGNSFEIFGADHGDIRFEELMRNQMDNIYFPVTMNEFQSNVTFKTIAEELLHVDGVLVKTMRLNHPGVCYGFRVEHDKKVFCYITDNELFLADDKEHFNQEFVDKLVKFMQFADVVVIDATYFDEDYVKKKGWGHSCVSQVVDVIDKAKVKLLCLHHHDPDQVDDDIDLKLQQAIAMLKSKNSATRCIAPHEGDQIII